jgi:hypothetical protein
VEPLHGGLLDERNFRDRGSVPFELDEPVQVEAVGGESWELPTGKYYIKMVRYYLRIETVVLEAAPLSVAELEIVIAKNFEERCSLTRRVDGRILSRTCEFKHPTQLGEFLYGPKCIQPGCNGVISSFTFEAEEQISLCPKHTTPKGSFHLGADDDDDDDDQKPPRYDRMRRQFQ